MGNGPIANLIFCRSDCQSDLLFNHRVSDGAEAAQFMQKLAGFLENPVRMLV
ncbi:MAG: hypothetical protein C4557_02760 [Anaerolineaceae bacterium]|nr:MAG: hypothetical protein C4557_02760 [Anaerolineaceae bacterium]